MIWDCFAKHVNAMAIRPWTWHTFWIEEAFMIINENKYRKLILYDYCWQVVDCMSSMKKDNTGYDIKQLFIGMLLVYRFASNQTCNGSGHTQFMFRTRLLIFRCWSQKKLLIIPVLNIKFLTFRRICNFLIGSHPDPNFTQIVVKCLRMKDLMIFQRVLWYCESKNIPYITR